ncbi:Dorsal-ventral patterning protein Sog [Chionoecetes opilio]|uniref:Dorsal-ventral patterning protein Sog n=1 Tax=Chionoecetes opilio TaxID=41210 RepID=A0A8J5CUR2_CHIOP|nr:Dorsal-ventral patterning protein Sog [Chionoecetes opilio]
MDGVAVVEEVVVEVVEEVEVVERGRERGRRNFAVLLNGRSSLTPMTTTRVATGRLFLRRRTLHFSFLLEGGAPTPASIQFLNEVGEILEQLEPQPTPYEATNSRVCGTWTRLPREYRTLLLEEKLWVALNPPEGSDEDVISGQVARYVGVDTEVFSALLTPATPSADAPPAPQHGLSGGGTAIISVDRKTDSLHVSLVFNGVFGAGETWNVSLRVELVPERALEPVADTIVLPKVYSDVNRGELLTTLGERSLIRLTRGQVSLRIWSVAAPHLALQGVITPRATCNVFCAVLSEPPPDDSASLSVSPPPYGAGWALVTLSNDGTFQHQVFVQGMAVAALKLETRHRRRHREVTDLTSDYRDGWANGTYDRPTYRDLDALLRGRVEVVVQGSGSGGRRLQGTLSPVAVTEALRSRQPVLLASPQVPMAAAVWVAVDSACVTHYDVMVAGRPPGGAAEPLWSLLLREDDHSWDPRYELQKVSLEDEVQGWELFAHTLVLVHVSLSRLGQGVTYLDLHLLPNTSHPNTSHPNTTLSGRVQGVSVPSPCLLDPALFHLPATRPPCTDPDCIVSDMGDLPPPITHKCIIDDGPGVEEKRVVNNGKSWVSPHDRCRMCMCAQGRVQCNDVVCHALACARAHTPPGQCCPVCPGSENLAGASEMCELNEQQHHVGSKWHPFLPPSGFDKCVSCSCEVQECSWHIRVGTAGATLLLCGADVMLNPKGRATVNCSRAPCPDLPCGPGEMEHTEGSCCAQCRPPRSPQPRPTYPPDVMSEGQLRTEEDHRDSILSRGGCLRHTVSTEESPPIFPVGRGFNGGRPTPSSQSHMVIILYENGKEWHPRINTIGYYKCVTCKCKVRPALADGNITCDNVKCPTIQCHEIMRDRRECCPHCVGENSTLRPSRGKKRRNKFKSRPLNSG